MNKFTNQHRRHLNHIVKLAVILLKKKYKAGAIEHGGKLWAIDPMIKIDEAIFEATDQMVYLLSLKDDLKEIKKQCKRQGCNSWESHFQRAESRFKNAIRRRDNNITRTAHQGNQKWGI